MKSLYLAALIGLFACQAAGCAPVVHAFAHGHERAQMVADARTIASGLRVPKPFADALILQALRASGGGAIAADDGELREHALAAMALEGVSVCPETGACLAALAATLRDGRLPRDAEVVVFNTGAAQKYVEVLRRELPRLRRAAVDWDLLGAAR